MARPPIGPCSRENGGSRQLSLLIPVAIHDELGRLATLNGESMNAVIRRAVDQYLAGELIATPGAEALRARILHDELGHSLGRLAALPQGVA